MNSWRFALLGLVVSWPGMLLAAPDPLPREVVVFVAGKLARTLSLEDTLEGGDARRASRWR